MALFGLAGKLRSLRKVATFALEFRCTLGTSNRYYSGSVKLLSNEKMRVFDIHGNQIPVPPELIPLNEDNYIDAALRSSRTNEVFIFCYNTYLVINYDPTSPGKCQIVKEPFMLIDGFPNLYRTPFSADGVGAAFGCHDVNQAYLFSESFCAKVEYGPDIHIGNMIDGSYPKSIVHMFPCLENSCFSYNIDAAFESTLVGEAYLFNGPKYVLINYKLKTVLSTGLITDAFPCLLNTKFATDIKATFASHLPNQAYLFKGDNSYVLIHYTPHSNEPNDSYIISGPDEMVPSNWPALQDIVPYNRRFRLWTPRTWTPVWRRAKPYKKVLATPPRIPI